MAAEPHGSETAETSTGGLDSGGGRQPALGTDWVLGALLFSALHRAAGAGRAAEGSGRELPLPPAPCPGPRGPAGTQRVCACAGLRGHACVPRSVRAPVHVRVCALEPLSAARTHPCRLGEAPLPAPPRGPGPGPAARSRSPCRNHRAPPLSPWGRGHGRGRGPTWGRREQGVPRLGRGSRGQLKF